MVLDKLGDSLRSALSKLTGASHVDEKLINEIVKEFQRALLKSDVNVKLVFELTSTIKERAKQKTPPGLTKKEQIVNIIYEELAQFLGGESTGLHVDKKPFTIMLVGLFGNGKTTTAGKLAKYFKTRGKTVALISTDTWRPAAFEQLKQLGSQVDVPVFGDPSMDDPAKIYEKYEPELQKHDVIICDTAGRDSLNDELVTEIQDIGESISQKIEEIAKTRDLEQLHELEDEVPPSLRELLNLDELINWEDTTTAPTPIELPDLNSSVTANIDTMIVTGVTMYNLQAEANTTPKQITMNKGSLQLFDGEVTGSFTWDVPQPDRTMITFNGSLDSLQADAFFSEYQVLGEKSKFHQYITGSFSADVEYYSELNVYLEPLIETSEMDGNFGMTKSRLQGHPLQNRVASLLNTPEFKNIALDEWKSTYSLNNSVFTIKDLRLTSGDIGMELNGTQHLVKGNINYQMKLFLPGRFKNAIAKVITKQAADALTQENGTIMLPLRVTGTHEDPKIAPDKEVIGPIVKEYLKDKAGNVLKKLFDG